MTSHEFEPLSPQGQARREAMLDELVAYTEKLHHHRRTRRQVVATAVTVCVVALLINVSLRDDSDPAPAPGMVQNETGTKSNENPNERDQVAHKPVGELDNDDNIVKLIATNPVILARYAVAPTSRIERLDDSELLETLESIGRPADLLRDGDHLRLSVPVTDRELGIP